MNTQQQQPATDELLVEERFRVVDPRSVHLEVRIRNDATEDGLAENVLFAELAEISIDKVRMLIDVPLSEADAVTMRITSEALSQPIEVDGRINWLTVASCGRFQVGCSFKSPVSSELLQELATAHLVERRDDRREAMTGVTIAKWELQQEESEVELLNISRGGCSFFSAVVGRPGQRVKMTIIGEHAERLDICVRAQWVVESKNGYAVGCEFADKQSYARIRRYAAEQRDEGAPRSAWWRRLVTHG